MRPLLFALLICLPLFFSASARGVVKIVKVENSPPLPGAKARIVSPKNGQAVFSMVPKVRLEVSGFETGAQTDFPRREMIANSGKGQHIHLIADNSPYKAIYDVSEPVALSGLGAGAHTLIVFPSRSYHESVKSEGAAHVVNFSVISSFGSDYPLDLSSPGIIYSRPKGVYEGADAERVMVDFYLHGAELGEDAYKVKLSIFEGAGPSDDSLATSEIFTRWRPAFVEGLATGEYTFRLELIDPSGKPVAARFGGADRIVKVIR